ncbi:MAG TPA: hypothetical protein VKT29_12285 [Terriglobales bacterium]|nr:hypothetical protein [Terriglobales bacterium]
MKSRPEPRFSTRLRVRVRGVDVFGHPFQQDAYTHDVSRRGARLDGTPSVIDTAAVIEVQHRGRRARFRVVWIGGYGTALHAQAGLQCLEPEHCIWGQLPSAAIPSTI